MQIINGDIIKHRLFTDVAFAVYSVKFLWGKYWVTGVWLNMGVEKTYVCATKETYQTIPISAAKLHDWARCKTPDDECIRKSEWEDLKGEH